MQQPYRLSADRTGRTPGVRVLTFHQAYACRHAGDCCSSRWPIPVEADRLSTLEHAIASGRLRLELTETTSLFDRPPTAPPDTPAILGQRHGRCVFHTEAQRCAVHAQLGHAALPLACRQFPRVTVRDPRGASVTLSHYCPTAAEHLGHDEPGGRAGDIAVNPPRFPADGEYVGLDARDALPPLLGPGMLMDWEGWWRLEELAVGTLLRSGASAAGAVGLLRGAVARLRHWRPGRQPLAQAVGEAVGRADPLPPSAPDAVLVARALAAVPDEYRGQADWREAVVTPDAITRRFLAAHAFANWHVHGREGLAAWLTSIETAHAFLSEGAGVRHADLVLRHLLG